MNKEGPPLELLIRRTIDTPPDFLAEPKCGARGVVHVDAIAADVAGMFGTRAPVRELVPFASPDAGARNRLTLVLLACWVVADDWFRNAGIAPTEVLRALLATATELSPHADAKSFHTDPDRREELARTLLTQLGYRPAGESLAQAQDRLVSVSAAERQRAVKATRGAAERARKIREALARKAAEESADKMWRE